MDVETALIWIRPLAEGIDPNTGELFPHDSPYQHAQVVRALLRAVAALEEEHGRTERRLRLPGKAGAPWSEEEDERLGALFDAGESIAEIARTHQRTRTAIQARLVKLGKMSAPT